jgi:hypothetical protein
MTYSDKLKSPHWQKKRLEILSRDEFTCQYCFDKDTQLQVHHLKYEGSKPEETNSDYLITLCVDCHSVAEYFIKKHKSVPKIPLIELLRTVKQECVYGKLIFCACSDLKVRLLIIHTDKSVSIFAIVNTDLIKF